MVLKLYEDASSSKINFPKSQALWAGIYKNRIDQPGQMKWSQFSINFGNSILDDLNWDKISEGVIKKPYLEQSETLFER